MSQLQKSETRLLAAPRHRSRHCDQTSAGVEKTLYSRRMCVAVPVGREDGEALTTRVDLSWFALFSLFQAPQKVQGPYHTWFMHGRSLWGHPKTILKLFCTPSKMDVSKPFDQLRVPFGLLKPLDLPRSDVPEPRLPRLACQLRTKSCRCHQRCPHNPRRGVDDMDFSAGGARVAREAAKTPGRRGGWEG